MGKNTKSRGKLFFFLLTIIYIINTLLVYLGTELIIAIDFIIALESTIEITTYIELGAIILFYIINFIIMCLMFLKLSRKEMKQ